MNKARVAEAARGIIQRKNVRKDLNVDFVFSALGGPASGWHKTRVYPNLKWSRSDVHRIEDPDETSGIDSWKDGKTNGTKQRARNQKIPTSRKGFF